MSYKTQNPHMELVAEYYGDLKFEQYFHKNFSKPVKGREWYSWYDGIVTDFEDFYKKYIDKYYSHVLAEDYTTYKGYIIHWQNFMDSRFQPTALKGLVKITENNSKDVEAYCYTNSVLDSKPIIVYKSLDVFKQDFAEIGWQSEFCNPTIPVVEKVLWSKQEEY